MTNSNDKPTNVVIAGLGGQGVLKASDILAEAAFRQGLTVKKAEVHGMSQRGGSVASDVRFGAEVLSPMIPAAEADFLLVLSADQVEIARPRLAENGVLVHPDCIDVKSLKNRKSFNVALLGALSAHLAIEKEHWLEAIRANLPEKVWEVNEQAFDYGRECGAV